MTASSLDLEAILRRDRWIVTAALCVASLSAWLLVVGADGISGATAMGVMGPAPVASAATQAVLGFLMWWAMMVAMMLPGAAPTILLVAAINRRVEPERRPFGSAAWFAAGYLLAWAVFAAFAAGAQGWLTGRGLLSSEHGVAMPALAGGLLVSAGVWQLTPLKQRCLRLCRSPVAHLTTHRHRGSLGGLRMGLEHGVFCLGCCWFLMGLVFVGGATNLLWVIGLAIYVWVEQVLPIGPRTGRGLGLALLVAGLFVLRQVA